MITLIANTGIQFATTELDFNPSEPVLVNGVPVPALYFVEYPGSEPNVNCFELAFSHQNKNFIYSELRSQHCLRVKVDSYGTEHDEYDLAGKPMVDVAKINPNTLWNLSQDQCYGEFNAEGSFQLIDAEGKTYTPWSKIIGKWLPVPMFYASEDNSTLNSYPTSWCRVRIDLVSTGKKANRYRLTWAFDTGLAVDGDNNLPIFPQNTHFLDFNVCNRVGQYIRFLQENAWVSDYMASLIFGADMQPAYKVGQFIQRCRHLGYYISLFTQLFNAGGCPQVRLFNRDIEPVKVDLVLDIGNSRTCGVFYEENDLSTGTLMSLRDIDEPWRVYDGSFDMRLAFYRAEFGENNMGQSMAFNWRSFVRIGEEAKRLISKERHLDGMAARLTHHSSPKRYLWDDEPYQGRWEFLTTEESFIPQRDSVYVTRLSEQFNLDGTFKTKEDVIHDANQTGSFSRRSLMTMVMIEILQQAFMQMNSYEYLNIGKGRGQVDRARVINNIIVTCPTAMSKEEQVVLRRCAHDAYIAIQRSLNPDVLFEVYDPDQWANKVNVVPREEDLLMTRQNGFGQKVEWGFDEATCCQMVYLYSEIANRYRGNGSKVIEAKGHVRPELAANGYNQKSLTVGSVDIGAGTTDLMICTYKYDQQGNRSVLTPMPLFWDSFNSAGDDLLQEIVMRVVLKGNDTADYDKRKGSIYNALVAHMVGDKIHNLIIRLIVR